MTPGASSQAEADRDTRHGYAPVNGLEMYYEIHPEILAGIQTMTPDALIGSPFHEEYLRLNPKPDDFPTLVEKVKRMDAEIPSFPPETIRSITIPTLLVNGDTDIVRPEHVVEMFRLLGGCVPRFDGSVSPTQLAILPGTDHVTLMHRADLLLPIVEAFLAAPVPGGVR
jgi:pimeloyl-ACP methyl ester carboxylesterase